MRVETMQIGQPVRWIQTIGTVGLKVTTYAVIADVRPDGRYVVRFVGKSGRPVQRIAKAESVVAR